MYIALNRIENSSEYCLAWYDGEGRTRVDQSGCAVAKMPANQSFWDGSLARHSVCPAGKPPQAPSADAATWAALTRAARTLGGALGLPFRVDLFVGERGVMLGEFTENAFGASFHCACVESDPCHLGRMWRERGPYGGPLLPTPPMLRSWPAAVSDISLQCLPHTNASSMWSARSGWSQT